jgi:hypothetical protein
MEMNLGCSVAGKQETGWLYQQTYELDVLGVHLTYSGDNPFLLKLVPSAGSDDVHNSRMPLFVHPGAIFPPTAVCPTTGTRLGLPIPFRTDVPTESLVFLHHVAQICPDVTHMMIRLVEFDLKRMAMLLLKVKHPNYEVSLKALEDNLTQRQIKAPFQFFIDKRGNSYAQLYFSCLMGRRHHAILILQFHIFIFA